MRFGKMKKFVRVDTFAHAGLPKIKKKQLQLELCVSFNLRPISTYEFEIFGYLRYQLNIFFNCILKLHFFTEITFFRLCFEFNF